MVRRAQLPDPGWFHACAHAFAKTFDETRLNPEFVDAFRLVTHPDVGRIKLVPSKGFQMTDGDICESYDGLTKPLELFHPCNLGVSTGGASTGGAGRGNDTDTEIANLINKGIEPKSGDFNEFAHRALTYLRDNNLQPFASQFIVADRRLGIATALDILCIDLDATGSHNIVNVQLKTHGPRNYTLANGTFVAPHPDIPGGKAIRRIRDSHYSRHQLQVLMEHAILNKNYGNLALRSMILLVTSEGATGYKICPDIRAIVAPVYRTLEHRHSDRINRAEVFAAGFASKARFRHNKRVLGAGGSARAASVNARK